MPLVLHLFIFLKAGPKRDQGKQIHLIHQWQHIQRIWWASGNEATGQRSRI